MECKHKNKLHHANFCKTECYYCTFQQEATCKRKHPEYFVGCNFCEDKDGMHEVVCYIPLDSGNAIDIPVNFCPNCGRKLT
jgi:hypothetical protein